MPTDPTVLLADADVLIDYRESVLAILGLVGQHVGRVAVLPSVSRPGCFRASGPRP